MQPGCVEQGIVRPDEARGSFRPRCRDRSIHQEFKAGKKLFALVRKVRSARQFPQSGAFVEIVERAGRFALKPTVQVTKPSPLHAPSEAILRDETEIRSQQGDRPAAGELDLFPEHEERAERVTGDAIKAVSFVQEFVFRKRRHNRVSGVRENAGGQIPQPFGGDSPTVDPKDVHWILESDSDARASAARIRA